MENQPSTEKLLAQFRQTPMSEALINTFMANTSEPYKQLRDEFSIILLADVKDDLLKGNDLSKADELKFSLLLRAFRNTTNLLRDHQLNLEFWACSSNDLMKGGKDSLLRFACVSAKAIRTGEWSCDRGEGYYYCINVALEHVRLPSRPGKWIFKKMWELALMASELDNPLDEQPTYWVDEDKA